MRIATFLLGLIAYLPFSMVYPLSDAVAWMLSSIIGYRKEVIRTNLQNSFPEKHEKDIQELTKSYYKYMADLMLETIKLERMSADDIKKRCRFLNPEVMDHARQYGKNIIIMMGHSGNWEWAGCSTELHYDFNLLPIYRKIKNPAFDRYFFRLRSRFGSVPIRDSESFERIAPIQTPHAVAMLADQTPGSRKGWWSKFLHQDTPFFRGSEVLAKRLKYEVVFAHVRRSERGFYEIHLEAFKGDLSKRFELTKGFADFLEKEINRDPVNWLWSHKRWKHSPKDSSIWMT